MQGRFLGHRRLLIGFLLTCATVAFMATVNTGCALGPSSTTSTTPASSKVEIRGLEAVPSGHAVLVEAQTHGPAAEADRTVTCLLIPELGVFRMELGGQTFPAEMILTVRTPEGQAGYRGQAVLRGKPRPLTMAYLDSPLTYPAGGWRLATISANGNHVSAKLERGQGAALETSTVEADLDPATGMIVKETQTRQQLQSTITRRLVPLDRVQIPALADVEESAREDWRETVALCCALEYPVYGLALPSLQLHRLQFDEDNVWLDYSTQGQPGRLAVRTWQMPTAETEAAPDRFAAHWTPASAEDGQGGYVCTFFSGERAVQVFVYSWLVDALPGVLERIPDFLVPLAQTALAQDPVPPVIVFDELMPLPSWADFAGLLPESLR